MPPQFSQSSSARAPRRKSVLFCPDCGHESRVDGDWQVQTRDDRHVYGCPACDAVVSERPATAQSPVSSSSRDPPAGGSLLARSFRLAVVWAAWPYTPAEWAHGYAVGTPSRTDTASTTMSALAA